VNQRDRVSGVVEWRFAPNWSLRTQMGGARERRCAGRFATERAGDFHRSEAEKASLRSERQPLDAVQVEGRHHG